MAKKTPFTDKQAFELMGQVVTVTTIVEREYDCQACTGNSSTITRIWRDVVLQTPRAGWVVGVRNRYNGKRVFEHSEEGPWWVPNGEVVRVLLVAFSPRGKHVSVPLHGFTLGGVPGRPDRSWPEPYKTYQREAMKEVPRDARGRWMKLE